MKNSVFLTWNEGIFVFNIVSRRTQVFFKKHTVNLDYNKGKFVHFLQVQLYSFEGI